MIRGKAPVFGIVQSIHGNPLRIARLTVMCTVLCRLSMERPVHFHGEDSRSLGISPISTGTRTVARVRVPRICIGPGGRGAR